MKTDYGIGIVSRQRSSVQIYVCCKWTNLELPVLSTVAQSPRDHNELVNNEKYLSTLNFYYIS